MDLYLTRLVFVFFMRSEFYDLEDLELKIREKCKDFSDAKKVVFPKIPLPSELNLFQDENIFSLNKDYKSIVFGKRRIELSIQTVFEKSIYDKTINIFCDSVKDIMPFVITDDNICSRLGFVNNSFYPTDSKNKADSILINSFFNINKFTDIYNTSFSYVENIDKFKYKLIKINSYSTGFLNSTPQKDGFIITRDINIPQNQRKISCKEVEKFISISYNHINLENMIKGIENA